MHDNHSSVRLEKKVGTGNSSEFTILDKMHIGRDSMADEERKECRKETIECWLLCAKEGKHKSRMPESEYPEVHQKKDYEIKPLWYQSGFLASREFSFVHFSLGTGHFQNIIKADDHILRPVQDQYGRDVPAEKQHAKQRNEVRCD